jgi:Ca2+-transporting ATPase
MNYYLEPVKAVFEKLDSSANGLSLTEAEERLAANGKNKLIEAKKVSLLRRFLSQLADPMIIILLAAAGISALTSVYSHEIPADVFIILAVVLINAVLVDTVQESKAEKAIEALKEMSAATSKVIRDGMMKSIHSEDLVIGDRMNMVYMGSVVVYGRGKALVTAAGMQTEMGKIADAIMNAEEGEQAQRSHTAAYGG